MVNYIIALFIIADALITIHYYRDKFQSVKSRNQMAISGLIVALGLLVNVITNNPIVQLVGIVSAIIAVILQLPLQSQESIKKVRQYEEKSNNKHQP